jgi:sugar/nucleoside kinase (ribokinase family)
VDDDRMSVTQAPRRLVLLGSVLVDIVMFVPRLPASGGDILATDSLVATGGGFNVLAAAGRQGLPSAYFGLHGDGTFGDIVRRDLSAEGVEVLLPRSGGEDTGFCIGLVDSAGERTYATRQGVEGRLTDEALSRFEPRATDAVYLSGYELVYEHGPLVGQRFAELPSQILTIFDPGPMVGEIAPDLLEAVLERANWTSLNRVEAETLTGSSQADQAARLWNETGSPHGSAVIRDGGNGCWVVVHHGTTEASVEHVAVPLAAADAVDTSGAGDCHVGAFVAALGRGYTPAEAALWANAAAAKSVMEKGPATAPTLEITQGDLDLSKTRGG